MIIINNSQDIAIKTQEKKYPIDFYSRQKQRKKKNNNNNNKKKRSKNNKTPHFIWAT